MTKLEMLNEMFEAGRFNTMLKEMTREQITAQLMRRTKDSVERLYNGGMKKRV